MLVSCRGSKRLLNGLALCVILSPGAHSSARAEGCGQPLSSGAAPTATDCLYLLRAAVGATACAMPCECAPKGTLPTSATDALLCLNAATGQPASLQCPCEATNSTTTSSSTTTTDSTSTTTLTANPCAEFGADGHLSGITDAHNDVRAAAMPEPDPALDPLCWSASVADVAQAWADNCTWQHNPGRGSLGENIFAGSGHWLASGASSAVNLWAAEADDYDYATNTCAPGKVCGHYTQIVWRSSESLGCGIKLCNTGSPFGGGSWTFVVCNYAPPGNWIGQRPY
jgi:pathogenesis-related protein 1